MSDFIDNTTVIEVEETPINTIGLTTNKHDELENRFEPDQHTIAAITGLSDELEKLMAGQFVKGKGYAEYWSWADKNIQQAQRIGYFVSLIKDDNDNNCIEIINDGNYHIFGVTVPNDTIAFIGNEEWEPIIDEETQTVAAYESTRDASYGLVCLVGDTKVRYHTNNTGELDIQIGDYVRPRTDGYAVKATNNDGLYRVVGTGYNDIYGYYVEINLSISASDVDNISVKHAKSADNYTDNGTIKQKLDDLNSKIDSEIDNIENGATIVGKAKNFDTTEGTIKDGFDNIKERFDDIKDGTIIVGHANSTDYINIKNVEYGVIKPYDIKTCTTASLENMTEPLSDSVYIITDDTTVEDIANWKAGVETGKTAVPKAETADKAIMDSEGVWIRDSYYCLGTGSRKLNGDGVLHPINNLNAVIHGGVYYIDCKYKDQMSNLPNEVSMGNVDYARLIVEATDQEDSEGNTNTHIRQTIHCHMTSSDNSLAEFTTTMRAGTIDVNGNRVWTPWDSMLMTSKATELTVSRAIGDEKGNNIAENYSQKSQFIINKTNKTVTASIGSICTLWCKSSDVYDKIVQLGSNFTSNSLYIAYNTTLDKLDSFANTIQSGNQYTLVGTWKLCGLSGTYNTGTTDGNLYIIQRVL